jgi:uncharacterized protein YndB with AHSA1/START domain
MPDIVHRVSIDSPREHVHELIATTDGIARWWTGRPLGGDSRTGGRFVVHFADGEEPAAVMEVLSDTPDQVAWRVVDGPDPWIDTVITFLLRRTGDRGTTLLFTHAGWRETSEFMGGCTTNWGAYLTSLKAGSEGQPFRAYPAGEISRWQ